MNQTEGGDHSRCASAIHVFLPRTDCQPVLESLDSGSRANGAVSGDTLLEQAVEIRCLVRDAGVRGCLAGVCHRLLSGDVHQIIDKVSVPDLPARTDGSLVVDAGRAGSETD
jgi:hypothetical protein